MGFGLQYQVIDGKPVLLEILHETDNEVISVLISSSSGDKLQAIEYDVTKLVINHTDYGCELTPNNIKAVIPIKVGDFIVKTGLYRHESEIEILSCPIQFISDGWASGEEMDITVDNLASNIDGFINCCQKYDRTEQDYVSNSPAVLLSIFNVINPRNAVTYHIASKVY